MSREQMFAAIVLFGLLVIAVVGDLRRHRIANLLILSGLALGLSTQVHAGGIAGLGSAALGLLVGFGALLPLYALGGMAAGDVKLMAMVGSFLSPQATLWAVLFSLIAGGLCGFLLILARGQLSMTLSRYWLMLRARAYMAPAEDEVAGKPFPYSLAILLGTLCSGYFILLKGGL